MIRVMATIDNIQFPATAEFKRAVEAEAAKLNLSLSAYFLYLYSRQKQGQDAARLDRHVREVFGKHGELIRRLGK